MAAMVRGCKVAGVAATFGKRDTAGATVGAAVDVAVVNRVDGEMFSVVPALAASLVVMHTFHPMLIRAAFWIVA